MPGTITNRTRTSPPTWHVPLNRHHPLFPQVRLAMTMAGSTFDTKRRRSYTLGGSASFSGSNSRGWRMMEFSGSNTAGTQISTTLGAQGFSSIVPSGSLLWIIIGFRINSLGTRRAIFADFSAAGSGFSVRFEQAAANTYLFGIHNGAAEFSVTGPAVTIGCHIAALWVASDGTASMSLDGGAPSRGGTIATNPRATGQDFRLGSAGAFTTLPFDGGIGPFICGEATATETFTSGWNSEGAILALSRNPWAIWEDQVDYGFATTTAASQVSRWFYDMPMAA